MSKNNAMLDDLLKELDAAKEILKHRASQYGDNTSQIGEVLQALYPLGTHLHSAKEFTKFVILAHMVVKLVRHTCNPVYGDSLHDEANYALILNLLCREDRK